MGCISERPVEIRAMPKKRSVTIQIKGRSDFLGHLSNIYIVAIEYIISILEIVHTLSSRKKVEGLLSVAR